MLWPDDVTDEQLALAAAKCDEDEQTREGNSNECHLGKTVILDFIMVLTAILSGPRNCFLNFFASEFRIVWNLNFFTMFESFFYLSLNFCMMEFSKNDI